MASVPVAVIPAAGDGKRLGIQGGSKELCRVGVEQTPVIAGLLERLGIAGVRQAIVVIRPDKHDIQEALGPTFGRVALQYVDTERTPSSVHTIATALRQRPEQDRWVLGFPDILFEPRDAYRRVIRHYDLNQSDLVLGLVPSDRPDKADMVRCTTDGRVSELRIKQSESGLRNTWIVACWGPRFSDLLRQVADGPRSAQDNTELFVGSVINEAISMGMVIRAVTMLQGWALDIGTPGDLERAQELALSPSE